MPLDYFQDRLLELLWEGESPEAIRSQLLSDPKLADFHSYIEKMDEGMIGVAAELVHKWGYAG